MRKIPRKDIDDSARRTHRPCKIAIIRINYQPSAISHGLNDAENLPARCNDCICTFVDNCLTSTAGSAIGITEFVSPIKGVSGVFVAASSHCFADKPFVEACQLLTDLEYDKLELWFGESGSHLDLAQVAGDPEGFHSNFREMTRLTPVAFCLECDVTPELFVGLSKLGKLMRITQITIPASPLGTPFNSEIDRLRELLDIANKDGIRLSIKTKTGQLTEDPHTAVELCQSVRGLGITLDPSYYVCGPNRGKSFDQVFPYVYHLHLRDTTPTELQVQVGLGEIDYTRMIAQLRRENYTRALSVDLFHDLLTNDSRPLEMRKLRMLLETLL